MAEPVQQANQRGLTSAIRQRSAKGRSRSAGHREARVGGREPYQFSKCLRLVGQMARYDNAESANLVPMNAEELRLAHLGSEPKRFTVHANYPKIYRPERLRRRLSTVRSNHQLSDWCHPLEPLRILSIRAPAFPTAEISYSPGLNWVMASASRSSNDVSGTELTVRTALRWMVSASS